MDNVNSNIRRIDELGRIVIPKDIRKKLHIKDNEPLEIFIENEEIRIKKYSALPDIIEYIKYLVDLFSRQTNNKYIITDRTKIIASTEKEYEENSLSQILESYVLSGLEVKNEKKELSITNDKEVEAYMRILPIMVDGDRSGILIEYNEKKEIIEETSSKIFKNLIEKSVNNY